MIGEAKPLKSVIPSKNKGWTRMTLDVWILPNKSVLTIPGEGMLAWSVQDY
jgi:hypothetical protein